MNWRVILAGGVVLAVLGHPCMCPEVYGQGAQQTGAANNQLDPLSLARDSLKQKWSEFKEKFGDVVDGNPDELQKDSWKVQTRRYLDDAGLQKLEEDLRAWLEQIDIAQLLGVNVRKVTEFGLVIDNDPRRILEGTLKSDLELRNMVERKELNWAIDVGQKKIDLKLEKRPEAFDELEKMIRQKLHGAGFGAFLVSIEIPPAPPPFPPVPPAAPPNPPSGVQKEPIPIPTYGATPVQYVRPVERVCFLRRLFGCGGSVALPCYWSMDSNVLPPVPQLSVRNTYFSGEILSVFPSVSRHSPSSTVFADSDFSVRLAANFEGLASENMREVENRRGRSVIPASHQEVSQVPYLSGRSLTPTRMMVDSLFGAGSHLFWEGDYQSALAKFNSALELDPQDARLWYFRGFCQLALGNKEEAERSLVTAIICHERSPDKEKVSRALERVQGRFRTTLENLRLKAAVRDRKKATSEPHEIQALAGTY